MQEFKHVSIVIPTIDEPEITDVIRSIYSMCKHTDICEFLIIYSALSPMNHVKMLHEMQRSFPEVLIRCILQNGSGLGDALYTGFFCAKGTHILTIAADSENDPCDVSKMIELAKCHPQSIITASRRIAGDGFREYPFFKKIFNDIFYFFVRTAFAGKQTDITYLFQCTPRDVLCTHSFSKNHAAFVFEIAMLPEIDDIPVIEFPSVVGKRKSGKSHSSFRYYWSFFKYAIQILVKRVMN